MYGTTLRDSIERGRAGDGGDAMSQHDLERCGYEQRIADAALQWWSEYQPDTRANIDPNLLLLALRTADLVNLIKLRNHETNGTSEWCACGREVLSREAERRHLEEREAYLNARDVRARCGKQ